MARGVVRYLVIPIVAFGLVGCRVFDYEEREPWRAEAEEQCVAQRLVQSSQFMEPESALNGNGVCGMTRPFKVAAVSGGFVALEPKATLACPLVANVEGWFHEAIQPAAMAWFGSPVSEVKQISAYSCRTMNGQPGAAISEHAFGNALDIASFRFADGRELKVKDGWKGRPEEQGFLRTVHAAACERFSTVLAPGADMFHYDHIHVDLARRASGRNVCKPEPMTIRQPAPRLPENVPVARAAPAPWAQNAPQVADARAASPWSQNAPQPVQGAMAGPMVIEREPAIRAAGPPLVLGGQAPPPQSFSAQAPLADRVRQALGAPAPAQAPVPMQEPPGYPTGKQNPYGLVPPGRIPNARLGADPVVTGSIGSAAKKSSTVGADLMSPESIAEQKASSEPASVFNLPRGNQLAQ
ncbi:MAG: extensin family protein [Xanthobacteraceae bacterium]